MRAPPCLGVTMARVEMVREDVFDMDAAEPVGIAFDQACRLDPGPAKVAGVGSEPDEVGPEFVQQGDDLVLSLEHTPDVGVVERPEPFRLRGPRRRSRSSRWRG